MKIVVLGTRGIPDIMGGVETHCEELYPRIVALGHDVTVICRSPYVKDKTIEEFRNVRLKTIYAPRVKAIEAIVHSLLAVVQAWRMKPDIVHIHAIGPAIIVPLARLLGLKVVMTNHGPDYDRQKWGRIAKSVLKLGERFGTLFSNKVIVISDVIAGILRTKYGRSDTSLIYNGVTLPIKTHSRGFLIELGLKASDKYLFAAGRFVKEKGFHDLIDAYLESGLANNFRLVIAGDSDHEDAYSSSLKKKALSAGVILPGFVKGEKLNQLFSHASLFVLPSYHEGLPIVLLEAMSYGIDVVVSNIPANRLKILADSDFFKVADKSDLVRALRNKLADSIVKPRVYDLSSYDWDEIAKQTVKVYADAIEN